MHTYDLNVLEAGVEDGQGGRSRADRWDQGNEEGLWRKQTGPEMSIAVVRKVLHGITGLHYSREVH